MTARDSLEVLDEGEVVRRTAHGTDHRDCLRSYLLGHHDAEARGDLRQEADEERRPLPDRTLVDGEIGDLDEATGEHRADREIIGLSAVLIGWWSTEREHFEAGEPGARVGEGLAFLSRDRGRRAQ